MLPRASWVLGGPVFLATGVAWAGSLTALILRQSAARLLRPLVYVALAFFALAAIFDILPQSKQGLSWPIFVAAVSVGYGAFWLVGRYVAPICPACAMRRFEEQHDHAHGNGLIFLALALSVHCFIDGLGVSAASTVEVFFGPEGARPGRRSSGPLESRRQRSAAQSPDGSGPSRPNSGWPSCWLTSAERSST